MKFPTYEEWGEKVAEQVIDVYLINGRTIREWIEILSDKLTMLNKIRAEIEDEKIDFDLDIGQEIHYNRAIDDVLKIIDKYMEGANE